MDNLKKYYGLVIALFLSKYDLSAVEFLGFKSWRAAFNGIGEILDENPNNIKNMRDEYDAIYPNGRVGWQGRDVLTGSRKEVFDECNNLSEEQLKEKVLGIIAINKKNKSKPVLKNLSVLIKETRSHYSSSCSWEDVELSNEFKTAYKNHLNKNNYEIEYYDYTSVITTPNEKYIFVPNQWFVVASYATGVCKELFTYKCHFGKVLEYLGLEMDQSTVTDFKNGEMNNKKERFMSAAKNYFCDNGYDTDAADIMAKFLWKFATDYLWWNGSKTIDRGDFYISVVLSMLNLLAASNGYVAEIAYAYSGSEKLFSLTRDLGGMTNNLQGITYDIELKENETPTVLNTSSPNQTHRIVIKPSSIEKLNR